MQSHDCIYVVLRYVCKLSKSAIGLHSYLFFFCIILFLSLWILLSLSLYLSIYLVIQVLFVCPLFNFVRILSALCPILYRPISSTISLSFLQCIREVVFNTSLAFSLLFIFCTFTSPSLTVYFWLFVSHSPIFHL